MRKLFYTTASIWLIYLSYGLSQEVEWVKKIVGNVHFLDKPFIETNSNSYCFGFNFLSDTIINIDNKIIDPLTTQKGFFVFRSNFSNELIKITQPLSKNKILIRDIALLNQGYSLIIGEYYGLAIFDSVILDKSGKLVGNGLFLIKYDTTGKLIWSYPIKYIDYGSAQGEALTTDKNGNIYAAGLCGGRIILNSDTLSGCRGFILSTDSTGRTNWIKKIYGRIDGQSFSTNNMDIISDDLNHIAFVSNVAESGKVGIDTTIFTARNSDIFIAMLNNSGKVLWSNLIGGTYFDEVNEVKSKNGIIYLSGHTTGNLQYRGEILVKDSSSFVMALVAETGNLMWIQTFGNASSPSIALTKLGELVVSFSFNQPISIFNKTIVPTLSEYSTFEYYSSDILILMLDHSTGSILWQTSINGMGNERYPTIATDSVNNIYIISFLQGRTELGNFNFNIPYGAFLAKIKLPTLSLKLEDKNNLQISESEEFIKIRMSAKPHKSLLSCFNSIGEKLFTKDILPLTEFVELDKSTFTNGKYFCTIEHDGITETISFVINK